MVIIWDPADWSEVELLDYFVTVWALFSAMQVIMAIVKILATQLAGLRAARAIHTTLLTRVLHAPSSFFDVTPLGRVINRFTTDIDAVDRSMANTVTGLFQPMFQLVSIVGVVTVAMPFIIIMYLPVLLYYFNRAAIYRATVREVKRLNSVSKSPIFQSFSETLDGLITIRAFRSEDRVRVATGSRIDKNHLTLKLVESCRRWFAFRLQTCSAVLVLGAAVLLAANQAGKIGYVLDAATSGLALTYALNSILALQATIIQWTEMEIAMNSIERIKEYSELEQEGTALDVTETDYSNLDTVSAADRVPGWPREPTIRFVSAAAKYRPELSRVLDDINLEIAAGEKVGICGRTGSGKSTLMLLLFRFLELDAGSILIDGVDIARVRLAELRQNIAILPQDSLLFSGSVRDNLDPFDEHADETLWQALEQSQMASRLREGDGLQTSCGQGGEAFSVGERQLLCLARALLKNASIIVMDECTASVDMETDAVLQTMVRQVFARQTVLTIAHRLATIIDYDKIVVLDSGRVCECDSPAALLQQDGRFAALVADAGLSKSGVH